MPEYDFRCYGRFYEQLERCRKCKIKRHCSKAADPPLLDRRDLPDGVKEVVYNKLLPSSSNRYAEAEADRRFTRADLLEVIVFMAALDVRSLDLIMQKLDMPELRFTELAQKRKVTRQADQAAAGADSRAGRRPDLSPTQEHWRFTRAATKFYGGSMPYSQTNTRESLEKAKARLELLEELEILETEFALITNEYTQRRKHLEERINALEIKG